VPVESQGKFPIVSFRRAALYPAELRAREGLDSGTPPMRQRLAAEKKPIEGRHLISDIVPPLAAGDTGS